MSNLTDAQRQVENAANFRHKIATLHASAVGVMMVRSREPYRAIETLRDFAHAEGMGFRDWDMNSGWRQHDPNDPDATPRGDGTSDPVGALKKINGDDGSKGFEDGVYAMLYPHFFLPKAPPAIMLTKQLARTLTETKKRLVLVCPTSFQLPNELADDVVVLDFDTPSIKELDDLLTEILESSLPAKKQPTLSQEEREQILSGLAGMTSQEAETAIARAIVENRDSLPNVSARTLTDHILGIKTEVVRKSDVLELMDTQGMDQVGGLDNLKDWSNKRSMCFSQAARDFGIEAPRGIALIGPPGTGKSISAKALAAQLGLPLIKFDVSRVFQSLVGQSEERVREALKMVDSMAPCVVLFDECDKAFNEGGGGDGGVGKRILGNILTWMQETDAPVFNVFTANRVDNLPSELLRRGRLDEIFSVSTPSEEERREVLQIHLLKRGHEPDTIENLDAAVHASKGYVPSELEGAVKDALVEAFSNNRALTGDLIAEQLQYIVPLSEAFKEQFDHMEQWASNNARPANTGASEPRSRARNRQRPGDGTGSRGRAIAT